MKIPNFVDFFFLQAILSNKKENYCDWEIICWVLKCTAAAEKSSVLIDLVTYIPCQW